MEFAIKKLMPEKIIFCNGTALQQSSMVGGVPIRLLKGETLVIELEETSGTDLQSGCLYGAHARKKQI